MEQLSDQFSDRAVRSVFIYTREAHPGENYRHHQSMDDKRRNARAFQEHSKVRRQILLDDLSGSAHRAYGALPNMTWIMGRGGLITTGCSRPAARREARLRPTSVLGCRAIFSRQKRNPAKNSEAIRGGWGESIFTLTSDRGRQYFRPLGYESTQRSVA